MCFAVPYLLRVYYAFLNIVNLVLSVDALQIVVMSVTEHSSHDGFCKTETCSGINVNEVNY
jgi:hypothetical protein